MARSDTPGGDPRPTISGELYEWVDTAAPAPQQPAEAAIALADLVARDDPPQAASSGAASLAYVARVLRDPTQSAELTALLSPIHALSNEH